MTSLGKNLIASATTGFLFALAVGYFLTNASTDRVNAGQRLLAEVCHPFAADANHSGFDQLHPLGIAGHFGDQVSKLHVVISQHEERRDCSIDDVIVPLSETDRDRWVELVRSDPSNFLNDVGREFPVDDLGWEIFEIQEAKVDVRTRLLKILRIGATHDDFTTTITLVDSPEAKS